MSKTNKIPDAQKNAMLVCARTGLISKDNLKALGISTFTISNLLKSGHLKSEEILYNTKNNDVRECYYLSSKGSNYAKKHFDGVYSCQHSKHDIELNNRYSELSKEERTNFLTESNIRELIRDKISQIEDYEERERYSHMLEERELSPPDCGYINEAGEIQYIEIITNSYSQRDIEIKQQTVEFLGGSCDYYKV